MAGSGCATRPPTWRRTSASSASSPACWTAIQCRRDVLPGYSYRGGRLGISAVAHQNGTIRFGADPATSALDLNCKLHDVDNVYVVNASFFMSATAVNPTLTIIANALRVADHLAERLGTTTAAREVIPNGQSVDLTGPGSRDARLMPDAPARRR